MPAIQVFLDDGRPKRSKTIDYTGRTFEHLRTFSHPVFAHQCYFGGKWQRVWKYSDMPDEQLERIAIVIDELLRMAVELQRIVRGGGEQQIMVRQPGVMRILNGKAFKRVAYGKERDDWGANRQPCHDCGVTKGQLHRVGCDAEECPCCGGQSILCECERAD